VAINAKVSKNIYNIMWLQAHQIMVTHNSYPINGMFPCLGNGCSCVSAPL